METLKEGQRIGKLTLLRDTSKFYPKDYPHWECRCDCGNEVVDLPIEQIEKGDCGLCKIVCFLHKFSKDEHGNFKPLSEVLDALAVEWHKLEETEDNEEQYSTDRVSDNGECF